MNEPIFVKQKQYSKLEFDFSEKDSIQIISLEKNDPQIVTICRDNLKEVIELLKQQL